MTLSCKLLLDIQCHWWTRAANRIAKVRHLPPQGLQGPVHNWILFTKSWRIVSGVRKATAHIVVESREVVSTFQSSRHYFRFGPRCRLWHDGHINGPLHTSQDSPKDLNIQSIPCFMSPEKMSRQRRYVSAPHRLNVLIQQFQMCRIPKNECGSMRRLSGSYLTDSDVLGCRIPCFRMLYEDNSSQA